MGPTGSWSHEPMGPWRIGIGVFLGHPYLVDRGPGGTPGVGVPRFPVFCAISGFRKFLETSNGRLPPETGSVRPQTLRGCVSRDFARLTFRRPKFSSPRFLAIFGRSGRFFGVLGGLGGFWRVWEGLGMFWKVLEKFKNIEIF